MGLMEQARADILQITTDKKAGWAIDISFTTPNGYSPAVTVTISGIAIKHSIVNNEYGAPIKGKTARVSISEAALVAMEYPVRNGDNKVSLNKHTVSFVDSAGLTYHGIITEIYPDETTGSIVCTLGDYQ